MFIFPKGIWERSPVNGNDLVHKILHRTALYSAGPHPTSEQPELVPVTETVTNQGIRKTVSDGGRGEVQETTHNQVQSRVLGWIRFFIETQ